MEAIINSLNDRNKEFEAANLRQRSTINKLLDEKKENEITIQTLKDQVQKLQLEKPLDYTKWKEWSTDDVYKFFINMFNDDTLSPYMDKIKETIFESEYSGQDLPAITLSELRSEFNINKISIRRNIVVKIQQLINQNNNNNNKNDFEGANVPTAYI